jgi:antitoxin component YwqK of YwqJK toxin-antitoxin module
MSKGFLSIIFTIIVFTAFSQKEIDCLTLEDKDGVMYQNGKPFKGICFIRDNQGNPVSKTTYDRGLPNGEQINWYPNGNIMEVVNYVDFYRDGYAKFYYENGFIKKEGNYIHCVEDGKWIYYYPDGTIEHIEFWKDGQEAGTWQYFDEKGMFIKEEKK